MKHQLKTDRRGVNVWPCASRMQDEPSQVKSQAIGIDACEVLSYVNCVISRNFLQRSDITVLIDKYLYAVDVRWSSQCERVVVELCIGRLGRTGVSESSGTTESWTISDVLPCGE